MATFRTFLVLLAVSSWAQVEAAPAARRASPAQRSGEEGPPRSAKLGQSLAQHASKLVGRASLREVSTRVPDDCTGLVRHVYGTAGFAVDGRYARPGDNGVTALYRQARALNALHQRRPRPGDLVFFRETYDRNRDGRRNDGMTHIGIVESVGRDGTVSFVHRSGAGVTRSVMNVAKPRARIARSGRPINDYLRKPSGATRAYLTGELFAGYATHRALW